MDIDIHYFLVFWSCSGFVKSIASLFYSQRNTLFLSEKKKHLTFVLINFSFFFFINNIYSHTNFCRSLWLYGNRTMSSLNTIVMYSVFECVIYVLSMLISIPGLLSFTLVYPNTSSITWLNNRLFPKIFVCKIKVTYETWRPIFSKGKNGKVCTLTDRERFLEETRGIGGIGR